MIKTAISLSALSIIASASLALAQGAPPQATAALKSLITATTSGDYAAFQRPGTEAFNASISEDAFRKFAGNMGPIFQNGYDSAFLTTLKQQGFDVYLWKLTPKVGSDQFVAKLVFQDGKVYGFWVQ